jgi:hypothetical protein
MDSWYSKDLGDGILAATPSNEIKEIKEVFTRLYHVAGKPIDMAVFTRHELEGRLHCEVIAYFSPAAKIDYFLFFFSLFNFRFSFGFSLGFFCSSFLFLSLLPLSPIVTSPF